MSISHLGAFGQHFRLISPLSSFSDFLGTHLIYHDRNTRPLKPSFCVGGLSPMRYSVQLPLLVKARQNTSSVSPRVLCSGVSDGFGQSNSAIPSRSPLGHLGNFGLSFHCRRLVVVAFFITRAGWEGRTAVSRVVRFAKLLDILQYKFPRFLENIAVSGLHALLLFTFAMGLQSCYLSPIGRGLLWNSFYRSH